MKACFSVGGFGLRLTGLEYRISDLRLRTSDVYRCEEVVVSTWPLHTSEGAGMRFQRIGSIYPGLWTSCLLTDLCFTGPKAIP